MPFIHSILFVSVLLKRIECVWARKCQKKTKWKIFYWNWLLSCDRVVWALSSASDCGCDQNRFSFFSLSTFSGTSHLSPTSKIINIVVERTQRNKKKSRRKIETKFSAQKCNCISASTALFVTTSGMCVLVSSIMFFSSHMVFSRYKRFVIITSRVVHFFCANRFGHRANEFCLCVGLCVYRTYNRHHHQCLSIRYIMFSYHKSREAQRQSGANIPMHTTRLNDSNRMRKCCHKCAKCNTEKIKWNWRSLRDGNARKRTKCQRHFCIISIGNAWITLNISEYVKSIETFSLCTSDNWTFREIEIASTR